jgi:hypothetical protein
MLRWCGDETVAKEIVALLSTARLKAWTWQTPSQLQAEDQTSLVHAWPMPNTFDCFDLQQLETEFRVVQALALTILATIGHSQKTGLQTKACLWRYSPASL